MSFLKSAALAAPLCFVGVVFADAQDIVIESADQSVTIRGGVGILAIESREYVYPSTGAQDLLSLLIWQSTAPLLSTALEVRLPDNWSIDASASLAISGDSYMEDYDWIAPFVVGTPGMDNWTDRSVHPNTNLDWYFNGSLHAAYKFELEQGPDIQVHGGFEYTDVQWTANGGDYIYSDVGFRDDIGSFGPGRGITYRQQFPALMTGANAIFEHGSWTFDIGAKAGLTLGAKATDHHWLRDLRFVEDVFVAPVLGASAKAEYAVSESMDFTLSGKVDRIFLGRSNTNIFDIPTGAPSGGSTDASGADLISAALKVGLSGSF